MLGKSIRDDLRVWLNHPSSSACCQPKKVKIAETNDGEPESVVEEDDGGLWVDGLPVLRFGMISRDPAAACGGFHHPRRIAFEDRAFEAA